MINGSEFLAIRMLRCSVHLIYDHRLNIKYPVESEQLGANEIKINHFKYCIHNDKSVISLVRYS